MYRLFANIIILIAAGCATTSFANGGIKIINPMLESYLNSPFQGIRLRCEFGSFKESSVKATGLAASAQALIKCMPAPLAAAMRATYRTGPDYLQKTDPATLMNELASQLCDTKSILHSYYENNLPVYVDIAVSDGWNRNYYLKEARKDYPLFCSQYYEGLLSDVATLFGLKSVVNGNSILGKALNHKGIDTYRAMSQLVLTCAVKLLQGDSLGVCSR